MVTFMQILIVFLAYLIGSLSFAMIVSKKMKLADPHTYGSGNPGASNMLRGGNKQAAIYTLLGDALKGFVAVGIARLLTQWLELPDGTVGLAAIAVVLGHMYPVFFGFKGGKGVATVLGVLLAMSLMTLVWVAGIWAFMAWQFKKSSLASLVAIFCAPFLAFILIHHPTWGWSIFLIAILVIYRHKDNMKRICSGAELDICEQSGVK